jgi:hypothetical protein
MRAVVEMRWVGWDVGLQFDCSVTVLIGLDVHFSMTFFAEIIFNHFLILLHSKAAYLCINHLSLGHTPPTQT